MLSLTKIISGGQTGADRAALDWAMRADVEHGGWCPRGRRAEDGVIADVYLLEETPSAEYPQRTEWNVRDSDGTVIFSIDEMIFGGTELTRELAEQLGNPWLHVHSGLGADKAAQRLRAFIEQHDIRTLNVAGPRASSTPKIAEFVVEVLDMAFAE